MTRIQCTIATIVAVSLASAASTAIAADKLKLAVGQCGNWDSSPVELGMRTGTFAKHDLEIEALCTQGTGETQQAVIAGSADIGIGVGTLGAMGAFAKGAPIRIVSGSATGNADFWIVKAESPLKSIADATAANTVAYSTNGSSTHSVVLGLIKELGLKAKPIATGGPAATITLMMSGQVDTAARLRPARRRQDPRVCPRQRRAEPARANRAREHRQCRQPQGAARRAR